MPYQQQKTMWSLALTLIYSWPIPTPLTLKIRGGRDIFHVPPPAKGAGMISLLHPEHFGKIV